MIVAPSEQIIGVSCIKSSRTLDTRFCRSSVKSLTSVIWEAMKIDPYVIRFSSPLPLCSRITWANQLLVRLVDKQPDLKQHNYMQFLSMLDDYQYEWFAILDRQDTDLGNDCPQ